MPDRPGARAARDVLLRMRYTHKMAPKTTLVEFSVSLFDSFGESICSKGRSVIRLVHKPSSNVKPICR